MPRYPQKSNSSRGDPDCVYQPGMFASADAHKWSSTLLGLHHRAQGIAAFFILGLPSEVAGNSGGPGRSCAVPPETR